MAQSVGSGPSSQGGDEVRGPVDAGWFGAGLVPGAVRDGRYLGENGRWWLDLRVDTGVCGALSVDLHTVDGGEHLGGVTDPRGFDPLAGCWRVAWDRGPAGESIGWLAVRPVPDVPGRLDVRLHADAVPAGDAGGDGPTGFAATVTVNRVGDLLRTLGLETEVERGVRPPLGVVDRGERLDLEICLRRAGIEVRAAGASTEIDPPEGGVWQGVDVLGALNRAMEGAAQTGTRAPAFEARLLWLSRSDRPGLCGVMFDIEDLLPRQGAAVFVDEIRDRVPAAQADRRILQSAVHELGHVLNLTHPFATGDWNSLSVMNYDWCYRGGGAAQEYQDRFGWTFGADELRFLRHANRSAIVPGGAQFGSDEYWLQAAADGERLEPAATHGLRLWLTSSDAPGVDEPVTLGHGEPVFLGVSLANVGDRSVVVPRHVLDQKAGHLSLLIARDGAPATPFTPLMRRCYDAGTLAAPAPWLLRLGPRQSLHENVNLTFGGQGRALAEPGSYTVTPVLTLPPPPGQEQGVRVLGVPRTVRVGADDAPPAAAELLGSGAAMAVALGSTLDRPDLEEALDRARRRSVGTDRSGGGARTDRVRAVVDRIDGLAARRRRDHAAAAMLLRRAVERDGGIFDPQTREQTRRLARRCAADAARAAQQHSRSATFAVNGAGSGSAAVAAPVAPAVVVELVWPDPAGGLGRGRTAGVLRVNRLGQGWSVLAPVGQVLPALDPDTPLGAVLVVASEDGTTERVTAARIDLVRAPDAPPVLAMLWLPRPVRGEPSPLLADLALKAAPDGSDLWTLLAGSGVAPEGIETLQAAELDTWDAAARVALHGLTASDAAAAGILAPEPLPTVRVHTVAALDDVAGWICRLTNICQDDDGSSWPGPRGAGEDLVPRPYPFDRAEPFVAVQPDRPAGTPAQSAPAESAPAEAVPAEAVPVEAVPAEAGPAEAGPAEAGPAERVPAGGGPAEGDPAWGAPNGSRPQGQPAARKA